MIPLGPSLVRATIVCRSQFATGTTSSTTVMLKLQVLLLPHSSVTIQVTVCVPISRPLITKLLPKDTMMPLDDSSSYVAISLHASTAIGFGTLTFAKQYQKSVPTSKSAGQVNSGPTLSSSLITWTASTNSTSHQSSTVHVRTILLPPPHSFSTLSQ